MSRTKITALTDEQLALLPRWHDDWLAIGMDERPVDRVLASDAIGRAYATIGKPAPLIVFCESPATSSLGIAVWPHLFKKGASLRASLWDSLRDSLRDSLGDSLRASLWDSLWASLWDSLGASLRDSLWASLRASLGDSLGDSLRDSLGDSLRASLWDSLRDSLRASLWDSLWDSLGDSLGDSLRDSLGDSLRASLRDSLGASLRDSLWASLRDSLRDSLGDSLRAIANSTWFWGQHDAYWIAFYRFCEEIGVKYDPTAAKKLRIMEDLARSCGWIYLYENVCFVSGRPKVRTEIIERNGSQVHQLHCADGPAMSFADGFAIYAWHGTRVPDRVILHPNDLTPTEILGERNAEVRRVMIERYGQDRFVCEAGAKILDKGSDGELLAIDLPEDPDRRIVALRLRCPSTAAVYIIRVPPDQTEFIAAKAWTFDLKPEEYAFAQET